VISVSDDTNVQCRDVVSIKKHGEVVKSRKLGAKKTNLGSSALSVISFGDGNRKAFIEFSDMPSGRSCGVIVVESDSL
jgi:hypothetical protein